MIPKKYTGEKAIEAYAMRQNGMSLATIGRELDICKKTVNEWVNIVENNPDLKEKADQLLVSSEPKNKEIQVNKKSDHQMLDNFDLMIEQTKTNMSKKPKFKSPIVREWLKSHPNGKYAEFAKDANIEVSKSYFSLIKSKVCKKSKKKIISNNNLQKVCLQHLSKEKEKSSKIEDCLKNHKYVLVESDTSLREEIDFLKWCLNGERHGWVDKLLEELKQI